MTASPTNPDPPLIEFTVAPGERGLRLDKALAGRVEGQSRSYLKELAELGHVHVDGESCPAKARLRVGQRVSCRLLPRHLLSPGGDAELPPLDVLFEDEVILVVNKPAGMATHPGGGHRWGTLSQAAEAHVGRPLPSPAEQDRGGIVHRLDRYTSGVIVLAKETNALAWLQQQFRERRVEKVYLALVHGEPRFVSDWIENRLERDADRPERIRTVSRRAIEAAEKAGAEQPGRAAETFYEVIERLGDTALVRCKPRTGRTHQIRVHLSSIDLPLIGEHVYKGRRHQGLELPAGAPPCERHLLHAAELGFLHPVSAEALRFSVEPPADFQQMLEFLRGFTAC